MLHEMIEASNLLLRRIHKMPPEKIYKERKFDFRKNADYDWVIPYNPESIFPDSEDSNMTQHQ